MMLQREAVPDDQHQQAAHPRRGLIPLTTLWRPDWSSQLTGAALAPAPRNPVPHFGGWELSSAGRPDQYTVLRTGP